MRLVNLTPHIVRINTGVSTIDIEPTIPAARVSVRHEKSCEIIVNGSGATVPIYRTVYGDVVGLPMEAEDTAYIVSQMVAQALPDRLDLLVPASGHHAVVRVDGLIYSVPGLVSLATKEGQQ